MEEDHLHHARLGIEDLNEIALAWRIQALRGDPTTKAIADALESVVQRRRAAALARDRVLSARSAFAHFRRAARWAVTRR